MKNNTMGRSSGFSPTLMTHETAGVSRWWLLLSTALILFFGNALTVNGAPITATLTNSQLATINTTSGGCTGTGPQGRFANTWTSDMDYWQFSFSTVGYTGIVFSTPTSSSGTGPHQGDAYLDWTGLVGGPIYLGTYSLSGTTCQTITYNLSTLTSNAVEGKTGVTVRLYMSEGTTTGYSNSGTNRVSINAVTGTSIGCAGTPEGGSLAASPTTICGSGSSTLTLSGATASGIGTNISYYYQTSSTGAVGSWSNVAGPVSATTYNTGTLSTPGTYYYRSFTTCSTSGLGDTTNTVTVTVAANPSLAAITNQPVVAPSYVGDLLDLNTVTTGVTWQSSNDDVAEVTNVANGEYEIVYGGTFIATVRKFTPPCAVTLSDTFDAVWPNTLALYAGGFNNGTSTRTILGRDREATVSTVGTTGMGGATACGSGGLSGKTVNPNITTWDDVDGPAYFSYKILPNSGYALNLHKIHAKVRRSEDGPTKARIAFSLNSGASWVVGGEVDLEEGGCGTTENDWYMDMAVNGITDLTHGITIALFPYASTTNTGTVQLNFLEAYGYTTDDTPCDEVVSPEKGAVLVSGEVTDTLCGEGQRWLELVHHGGVGISYQWQMKVGAGPWGNLSANDTNAWYQTAVLNQTTLYRVAILCEGGSTIYSDSAIIVVRSLPTATITNKQVTACVETTLDFNSNAGVGQTERWYSNYVSTAAIDSTNGEVDPLVFPGRVVVTLKLTDNATGCYGIDKDTFDVLHCCQIATYIGLGGSSTTVQYLDANLDATAVTATGFGSGTTCGNGGISGLTNAQGVFDPNAGDATYVSFKLGIDNGYTAIINGIKATTRRSNTGPVNVHLAFRSRFSGSWGPWIVENNTQTLPAADDCGYSYDEFVWGELSLPVPSFVYLDNAFLIDSVEVAVFADGADNVSGTFQVNSISVCGKVDVSCEYVLGIEEVGGGSIDGVDLPLGANDLEVSITGGTINNTYWGIIGEPNNIATGYFDFTDDVEAGDNTGDLTVVSQYCGAVVFAVVETTNTCLQPMVALPDFDGPCAGAKNANNISNVNKASSVSFYPNPASTIVNVIASGKVNVSVMSIDGKVLIEQNNAKSINIGKLASGMYMIKAFDENNNLVKTEKLIKQ